MTQPKQVYYTRHDGGVSMLIDGKPLTVSSNAPQFNRLLEALKAKDWKKVGELMNVANTINAQGISKKYKGLSVYVRDGNVYYLDSHKRERQLENTLVKRIISILGKPQADGFVDALMAFLNNVMKNEVKDIREELYEFLASGNVPLTYDGCFLAYKKVRADFKDQYSGKFDNSPGRICRLPQKEVDRDRNRECSTGLHFASLGYLPHYTGGPGEKVVIVKVNPRHVFAIPRDYECQKGRCSEYFVVGEYLEGAKRAQEGVEAFTDSFIDEKTKTASAPNVYFPSSLRPSLETRARSYGLINPDDKVIIVRDPKGNMIPVVEGEGGELTDVQGVEWMLDDGEEPEYMSFRTKSVIVALKKALAKVEN